MPKNENALSDQSLQNIARKFLFVIPFYLAVPLSIGIFFHYVFGYIHWKAFGLGALGWVVALMLRGPVTVLMKGLPKERAMLYIGLSSGPLEEGVRLILLLLTGSSFSWALSVGQGWAAIEVLFTIINGLALIYVLQQNDEKAIQAKEFLESQGTLYLNPWWGVVERIFATAFHIGATLLIAKIPLLTLILLIVHSLFNLTIVWIARKNMIFAQLLAAIVGTGLLVSGFIVFR
ncbi:MULTISPECIES: YhfC family intramembrane metalloprotease [Aneurinibacillus]|jgi:hypothetical protein|uniref:Uncharacterized membrane protein YhfC n=1 Tax=Aneurinibacillus thermoaerophilus TaxID=143495 RepID=A0A1G7Y1W4_ANETH|nr:MULTISPECIES: YhfC family intramembrane metalloprotease [Aneurinibacillus]AMA72961.1 hypothetical protein ACH33_08870 [Aneurinibacillus sp. XH2]MED0675902.1 YhfC family intramembrane metalloprotease [Aneurinibacillus thermoaerophilus]MED0737572.1 YhfC family intramembrane metalloprotease [Aneurinibacillus thermoaerophilus]MED0758143.1 YhfC family intramembrane metalloprotease [Aneurinibacillus thermoaerophilus]MED0761297.1 YhfC family intramembrane metalloprotease [Aneurinibacillus thermoae